MGRRLAGLSGAGGCMDAKMNGGPAFPVSTPSREEGMSLRDYFAAKIAAGDAAADDGWSMKTPDEALINRARLYYRIADAMLAARCAAPAACSADHPAPDLDGWIEWRGGACPVAGGHIVDVRLRCGDICSEAACEFDWFWREGKIADIVAYRLSTQKRDA